ncbi:GlxA family transcriptional regulator [Streptomyces sp. NRRL F-5126]|uniref:GlxA family transcriptional regulator n=1 Tax=Streptomyces sp. NRRL F-5126 TaxID=1463857 RepID=UPI0004CC6692|nr:DJ-1/PfpI family protein [Streptomyces sp. NRRL F-5126]
MRHVVFVVFEGFQPLDLTGPHEVFAHAHVLAGGYRLQVVAPRAGPVRSCSGLPMLAEYGVLDLAPDGIDTLVVVGGRGVDHARENADLVDWVRAAATTARRVTSVCSGALLLAATGLLEGRRVTTHWERETQLRRECPAIHVDCDPIFVRDGRFWTSAGVTAGIDLALALVDDDHGRGVALDVARELVMFLRRPGSQSQFSVPLWTTQPESDPIRTVVEAVHADPGADHTIAALADRAGWSTRHLQRRFPAELGIGATRYVEQVRVEAACRALTESDEPIEALARRLGFGSAETLRRAFHRRLGVSPSEYRDRFATVAPKEGTR